MLQAKTEEQKEYVRRRIVDECPLGNSVLNVYEDSVEADIASLSFDTMAEIVDYLRSVNKQKKNELDMSIVASDMVEVVKTWLAYKKEKGQSYKPTGFKTFYKKLCELSGNNPQVAMAIIEQSMQNNYAGIFPLRNNNNNQYGRFKTNSDAFDESVKESNEFSQKLHSRFGN